MALPLVVIFSTAVLHTVSAGGSYCAKTAKAALGLKYPGDHGAPDLSGPAPIMLHPKMLHYNDLAANELNMASYQHYELEAPFDDSVYEQPHPRSPDKVPLSHDATNQMVIFPRGQLVSKPESSSEVVEQVDLPNLAEVLDQFDLENLNPRGQKPFLYFYNEHAPAFESALIRPGMALNEFPVPQSWGRVHYGSPLNALGKAHGLNLYPHLKKGMSGIPSRGRWKMIRKPVRLAKHLYKGHHAKPFVQGKVVLKYLKKKLI